MNIRHLPLPFALGFVLGISSVVSNTPKAQAQSNNQSDITGTIITTSDIVGGFATGGGRRAITAFRTPQIRNAVNRAANSVNVQLASGNLPVVATVTPTAIPGAVQQSLQCVLTRTGNVDVCARQVEIALVNAGTSPTVSRNLVSSLRGLTARGQVDPAKFRTVVAAYNALINTSSDEFLSTPPEELRAIQSVLAVLLNAAYTR